MPGSSSLLLISLPVTLTTLGTVKLTGEGKLSTTQTPHSGYGLILTMLPSCHPALTATPASPFPTVGCGVCMHGWFQCLPRALHGHPAALRSHVFSMELRVWFVLAPSGLPALLLFALTSAHLLLSFPALACRCGQLETCPDGLEEFLLRGLTS